MYVLMSSDFPLAVYTDKYLAEDICNKLSNAARKRFKDPSNNDREIYFHIHEVIENEVSVGNVLDSGKHFIFTDIKRYL